MTNKMEQLCVFHDHLADDILFKCAINFCQNDSVSLRQFIAFSYIKQVQQYVSFVESIPSKIRNYAEFNQSFSAKNTVCLRVSASEMY